MCVTFNKTIHRSNFHFSDIEHFKTLLYPGTSNVLQSQQTLSVFYGSIISVSIDDKEQLIEPGPTSGAGNLF